MTTFPFCMAMLVGPDESDGDWELPDDEERVPNVAHCQVRDNHELGGTMAISAIHSKL